MKKIYITPVLNVHVMDYTGFLCMSTNDEVSHRESYSKSTTDFTEE